MHLFFISWSNHNLGKILSECHHTIPIPLVAAVEAALQIRKINLITGIVSLRLVAANHVVTFCL